MKKLKIKVSFRDNRGLIIDLLENISKDQLLIIMSHEPELFMNWTIASYQLSNGKLIESTKLE